MSIADKHRSVSATKMNARSSRSHSVFTLHIRGSNHVQGTVLKGSLNLCDLAGSERVSKSEVTGARLRETQCINKSLSCLSDVFLGLSQKNAHIPYRNSKLTFLLRGCFCKNGKTLMFVNLSPAMSSFSESLCSLRFASNVNRCILGKATKQIRHVSKQNNSDLENGSKNKTTRKKRRKLYNGS